MEMGDIKQRVLEDVNPLLKREKRKNTTRGYMIAMVQLAANLLLVLLVLYILIGISTVDGSSMYPTLHNDDVVLYQRRVTEYKVGDVVVVSRPDGREFVKRVVALAGDTVNLYEGKLYVNGKESEIQGPQGLTNRVSEHVPNPYIVQDNEVYVLGDNRENSEDSRSFGSVNLGDIKGRMLWYVGKLK